MIELRVSEPDPIVLEAEEQDQASLAVLEAFVSGGDIPAYTGSYNVTPTQSQQTLETNGKKMVRDVKVAPIPSQYIIPEGTLEVTQNGQQSVREYENVNVNVPAPTGEKTMNVTQNGTTTEDVANYATAKVVTNVPASAVDSGTKNINANGTHNVVGYASAEVNVPNSYAAADEGKVVQSGALVSQSSATYTENGTYDTTTKNEVVVNVSGGIPDWVRDTNAISFDASNAVVNGDVVFDFGSMDVYFKARKITSTKDDATMEIKCGVLTFQNAALSDFSGSSKFRTAILTCSNNPVPTAEFARATHFVHILGKPLSVTALGTKTYRIFNSLSIQEFYVVPNMIELGGGGLVTGVLYDATLVSLANGLKGGLATPQTLTISDATSKSKCDSIMGTVSSVTDDSGTYDFFTESASGTVSLTSFITNTKGWTLA